MKLKASTKGKSGKRNTCVIDDSEDQSEKDSSIPKNETQASALPVEKSKTVEYVIDDSTDQSEKNGTFPKIETKHSAVPGKDKSKKKKIIAVIRNFKIWKNRSEVLITVAEMKMIKDTSRIEKNDVKLKKETRKNTSPDVEVKQKPQCEDETTQRDTIDASLKSTHIDREEVNYDLILRELFKKRDHQVDQIIELVAVKKSMEKIKKEDPFLSKFFDTEKNTNSSSIEISTLEKNHLFLGCTRRIKTPLVMEVPHLF